MSAFVRLDDLHSVEDLAAAFPQVLSVQTLRWQLRYRTVNGLDAACVRAGKRLLISRSRYEEWLATRGSRPASEPTGAAAS